MPSKEPEGLPAFSHYHEVEIFICVRAMHEILLGVIEAWRKPTMTHSYD